MTGGPARTIPDQSVVDGPGMVRDPRLSQRGYKPPVLEAVGCQVILQAFSDVQ